VLETVQSKNDPQMVDYILEEKSWLNLHLCACITETENPTVAYQREKTSLHSVFIFSSKNINEIIVFKKYDCVSCPTVQSSIGPLAG
jgi:hypothetical protein